MTRLVAAWALVLLLVAAAAAEPRSWSTPSGKFSLQAELIAFNDRAIVLQREDHELVEVQLDQLCQEDQDFVRDFAAQLAEKPAPEGEQVWTLRSGLKFEGKVVGYTRRDVQVQRRRGKIYVNDRLFDNLPNLYQKMLPKVVAHFEQIDLPDEKALKAWVTSLRGAPRDYRVEGVMLELSTGDEHGLPFFFFSDKDLAVLKPGWDRWAAVQDEHEKASHEDLVLQAQAAAYQQGLRAGREQAASEATGPYGVSAMDLMAVDAGVTDLWEVRLTSGNQSISVVVSGPDSRVAAETALQRYPGASVGPIRKLN